MKFVVTVERDEDGAFVVECPAIPGCVSQGRTEREALDNVTDAIRQCLEVRAERGMPLTIATHVVEIDVSPRTTESSVRNMRRIRDRMSGEIRGMTAIEQIEYVERRAAEWKPAMSRSVNEPSLSAGDLGHSADIY